MWDKKIHVKSSLENNDGFAVFIGRWQILHDGHKGLFSQVLDAGGKILIMIRDMKPDEKNPLTSIQVYENICNFYSILIDEGRVKVMIIPNIDSVNFGRGVGYDIVEWIPPAEIGEISATKIRESQKINN